MSDKKLQSPQISPATGEKPAPRALPPAAQRALAEAQARRLAAEKDNIHNGSERAKEVEGPAGPEPTRYGDWEKKGIASDF
ncbi:MAG TPA: DUF1674 domain-containing protein [Afipia sp.]